MYRIYNKETGLYWNKRGWTKQGKVFMRKCDLVNSITWRGLKADDNLVVWEYIEKGIERVTPLREFTISKPRKERQNFQVAFKVTKTNIDIQLEMRSYYDPSWKNGMMRDHDFVAGNTTFVDTLTFVNMCGNHARFKNVNGVIFSMSPSYFCQVIKKLNNGVVTALWGYAKIGEAYSIRYIMPQNTSAVKFGTAQETTMAYTRDTYTILS